MAGAVTVTGPGSPCAQWAWNTDSNPTGTGIPTTQRVRYYLCLATHKAEAFISDAGHWIWDKLSWAWGELQNIFGSIGSGIVKAGTWVGHKIETAAQALEDEAKKILNWVDAQLGLAENWLLNAVLLVGGLFLAIELAPALVNITTPRHKHE